MLNPNLNVPRSPLYVSEYMTDIGWISCFVLQGLFALRGLAGAKNSEHYKNCLMLKIKFSFMALCLLFMILFVLASALESQSQLNKYLNATLVILEIFLLKIVIYLFIYRPIKYKDDGRELVSWFEFLTIHVTFPVLNAWVTYQLVYNVFIILATTCPFPVQENTFFWCTSQDTDDATVYYYDLFLVPSQLTYMIIIIEATINLAYYKDVVFGFMVLIEFSGMLYFSIQTEHQNPQPQNGQASQTLTSI